MATGALVSFLAGILFGLALAAPPGPMNAVIAEESVVRGWLSGFKAGLGAMSADLVFLAAALVGVVAVLQEFPRLRAVIILVGGVVMLYFAVDAARSASTTLTDAADVDGTRGFQKAFVLALTNPYQILFWLTVGVALLESGQVDVLSHTPYVGDALSGLVVVETGSVALLGGLFGGIVVWIVGFPATLVAVGKRIDAFAPLIASASAVVLAGFGLLFLWDGATTLL